MRAYVVGGWATRVKLG
ncbi:hypothetical protein Tco_0525283, partial [Tanacetum coccineum]